MGKFRMRNYMKQWVKWLSLSLAAMGFASAAHALGTDAGTTVSNTFTLDYEVSGTPQPTIDNTANPTEFTVDRLVDLTVTALNPTQTVAPGSTDNVTSFSLTNTGNDQQAYDLSVALPTPGAPDTPYTPTNVEIFWSDDGGTTLNPYTPGNTATYPILQPDDTITIYVESDVPVGEDDGDVADFVLTADTLYADDTLDPNCGSAGGDPCEAFTEVLPDADVINDLTNIAENYLNDAAGETDNANEGDHSAIAEKVVQAPTLDASKTVAVLDSDPASDAACSALTAPASAAEYSIPGACVLYTIELENTGTGTASALEIQDQLPAEVRFVAASLATTTTTGFADDAGVTGTGPTLTDPGAVIDCDGTNCLIELEDAELAGGEVGQILIWALVQ